MKHASKSLLKKLANFKQEKIAIAKDQQAYGYKYAPLDTILPVIEPLLHKHGLWYFHSTGFDKKSWRTYLKTVIYEIYEVDEDQGFIESKILIDDEVQLAKMNKYMVIGSALTYFRRYHLVTMLGLLTDEDTDTAVGAGRSVESASKPVDFVAMFEKMLPSKKSKEAALKTFKMYEANFSEDEKKAVSDLIDKKFKK